MNKLIAIALLIGLSACGPSAPEAPATPFKNWYCQFENVTPGAGPEHLFINLAHMEFDVESTFIEQVCMTDSGEMKCRQIVVIATLGSDGSINAIPQGAGTTPVTSTYTYTSTSFTVDDITGVGFGKLNCR